MSSNKFGTTADYYAAFKALQEEGIHKKHLAMLKAHFKCPQHTVTWAQLAKLVGYPNGGTVYLQGSTGI